MACATFASAAPVIDGAQTAAADTSSMPVAGPEHAAARAQMLLDQGIRLENGEGVARDPIRAHALYCAAARAQHVEAYLRLGWMYANGRGVARDDSMAHTLFARAAALGSDLGARLAQAIRGSEQREPDCLSPSAVTAGSGTDSSAAPVEPSTVVSRPDAGPTPVVSAPAQFRAAPTAPEHRKFVATVVAMARDFRLDPRLVFALIRVESGFDPLARSPKNAQGLMQLIPETAERFGVRDVWDPIENLRGGMSYLRWLLSYFKGDIVLTLAAYNAGEGAVDRHKGVPPFSETIAYVQRIRAFYPFDRHAFDPRIAALNPPSGPRREPGAAQPARASTPPTRAAAVQQPATVEPRRLSPRPVTQALPSDNAGGGRNG